jgi:AAA+ ATPase superfamily predicted ATPase
MEKKARFIGRQEELKRLIATTKKNTASFIVIKGRRRIGKSRLVNEFSKNFSHYYKFEGLAPDKKTTHAEQLNIFCGQISREFKIPKANYDDWSDAFWAVSERVKTGKILLFFDELSWMGSKDHLFLSNIKNFWDNQLKTNDQLIFIVASSASSWIEKNLLSSTGFVGRVSLTLKLEELSLFDCNQFWPKYISAYEKFKTLGVTGGIPKYLEEINPKESAEENIKQLCFTDGGILVKEFQRIFSDLFLRNSQFYKKIIDVLSNGTKEQTEIEEAVCKGHHIKHIGRISEYLWELSEAGFIRRDVTWDLKTGKDSKLSRYRLQDNYLRFYIKYIKNNLSKIERNAFNSKSLILLPEWNTIMGFQFENLVLNNRKTVHKLLDIKSDEIISENPFFQRKTLRNQGCQIDYLIQTKHGSLYICEIKFLKNTINSSIIEEVEKKFKKLTFPKGLSCRFVLIHVNGVDNSLIESDFFYRIIDMSELLTTSPI